MSTINRRQLKILFLGSSDFALTPLKRLLASEWPLLGVVTRPDRRRGRGRRVTPLPLKELAESAGLNVYQPERVADLQALFDSGAVQPDLILVVSYGQLLNDAVLTAPPFGCVNLHPSLLPRYRGAAPIQRAVLNGEHETGVSTMYLSSGIDDGDLILQQKVTVPEDATAGELAQLLSEKGSDLLLETVELIAAGRAPRHPQDNSQASYAPAITRGEELIRWNETGERLHALILGMNPSPGAYTLYKGKIVKIWRSRLVPQLKSEMVPGTVITADPKQGLVVATGQGGLLLTEVQPAGKVRMSGAELVRGYRIEPGTVLGA